MSAVIRWFITHRVAANLAMLCILVLGLLAVPRLQQELIPNVELDRISIQVLYPGASVSTTEQSLCTPLENAIHDIAGGEELISWSYPGLCSLTLDIAEGYDANALLAEIRSRLADPALLPAQAEAPDIQILQVRNRALRIIVSGDESYANLLSSAQSLRRELLALPAVSTAEIQDREKPEIRIQFSLADLYRYPLQLQQINRQLIQQAAPAAGGLLETGDGDILIGNDRDFRSASDYEHLLIASDGAGNRLRLADVASIQDTRTDATALALLNGKPALALDIYRSGNDDITAISAAVNTYLQQHPASANISYYVWQDEAVNFSERLNLLLDNALSGLLLLFIVLLLFLNARLSFWVSMGILVSFVGTLFVLPLTSTSVNFISLFAFILVLGIVVDDAVVVGEAVFARQELGEHGTQAALSGTLDVYKPVLFSVITTLVAFMPLLFLPGPEGMLIKAVPIVVITTLLFSLFESLCILPAHLSHTPANATKPHRLQQYFSRFLQQVVGHYYLPLLRRIVHNPYPVIATFTAAFILTLLLISQGWIKSALFSEIEGNVVTAKVTFPQGSPREATQKALQKLAVAARKVETSAGYAEGEMIRRIYQVVAPNTLPSNQKVYARADHTGQIMLELPAANSRAFSGQDMIRWWRAESGAITGVDNVEYSATVNPSKADIQIEFSGSDQQALNTAAQRLSDYLQRFSGIYSLQRQPDNNAQQLDIRLTDEAIAAGINRGPVLQQVNQAFYGTTIQRFYDNDDEVEVRTSLNAEERASAWYLDNLPVETAPGQTVALKYIATHSQQAVNPYIRHFMREPVVMVSAYVDPSQNNAERIKKTLQQGAVQNLLHDLPGVRWDVGGYQRAVQFFLDLLAQYYLFAIIVMYLLMAVLFASYAQPLLVLFAIPFGLLGAVVGHLILGLDLTLWSYVGMVAVSGVVVNDNLVLIDRLNQLKAKNLPIAEALLQACSSRFRPILLTSLTTFAGVLPLLSETSIQAKLLIPMAASLGFGVLFATIISLLLVPALCAVFKQPNAKEASTAAQAG